MNFFKIFTKKNNQSGVKNHNWKLDDTIIYVSEISDTAKVIGNIESELFFPITKCRPADTACIKSEKNIYIFIDKEKLNGLLKLKDLYNKETNTFNISNIMKFMKKNNTEIHIMNKISPKEIMIKYVAYCYIDSIEAEVTISKVYPIDCNHKIFKDLIRMQTYLDMEKIKR